MRFKRWVAVATVALLAWFLVGKGLALAAPSFTVRVVYGYNGVKLQQRTYYFYYWVPQREPQRTVTPTGSSLAEASTVNLTQEESAMLQLINKERQKAGLQPLSVDSRLVELARKKSQDMVDKGYFSHQSPTYGSPFDMMRAAGVTYKVAGENIAGAPTVETAHTALMNSPGHRSNILNPGFTRVGIGIVDGGPYGKTFTQMFIGT
ncbi:MAG: CAP domain-containing protein [Bacillota bacterium]